MNGVLQLGFRAADFPQNSDPAARLDSVALPDPRFLSFGRVRFLVSLRARVGGRASQESTLHLVLRLRGGHCQVPCGIFDDPKLVADVKEAVATIKKAMAPQ